MSRRHLAAALVALSLMAAACGGSSAEPTPASTEPTSVATEETTGTSTPTSGELPRSDDPITLTPIASEIPPSTVIPGMALVDVANSGVITLSPPFVPEPIDFREGSLLARDGDEYTLLDINQGEVARARAYGPHVDTSPFAPGVSLDDFDIAPDLAHFVSRRFSEDGATYDLVLVRVDGDMRTVVLEDQQPCSCDPFPRGLWSASGRYFLEVAADRVWMVDVVEGVVSEVSADAVAPGIVGAFSRWSPAADELLVAGPAGLSLLDAASGEATLLADEAVRFAFTSDGANIVITDRETNPTTRVLRRSNLEELRSYAGAVEDAVPLNRRVLVALSEVPGCEGIWVTDGVGPVVCFDAARGVALAGDGQVALLYTQQQNVGGRLALTWSVETFEPATQLRATVLAWTVEALNPASQDGVFMLWRDDGLALALYWPAGPR